MKTGPTKALLCMLLIMAGVTGAALNAAGQQGQMQQVLQELRALTARYYSAPQINFDVSYRYSKEESPGVYLDSLRGSCKISGTRYWFSMNSYETIDNKDTIVTLFKEDKVMYIARPAQPVPGNSPMSMLDSFFVDTSNYRFSIDTLQEERRITIAAKNPGAFKKTEYFINKHTGLVWRVANTVDASLLYDEAAQSLVEPGTNVIVEMVFRNYRFPPAGEGMPAPWQYFKKEAGQYVALPPYESYTIFLASPSF